MAINVYKWPPVYAVGWEWTVSDPVARLRSALTGRDQMQASQRRRRLATMIVSSRLTCNSAGAGYCEMLKEFLLGGIHAVRLSSGPVNWDRYSRRRDYIQGSELLEWLANDNPLFWRAGGNQMHWYVGYVVTGGTPTQDEGFWHLPVSGLPPNVLVTRPGEFVRVYSFADPSVSEVARAVSVTRTDDVGAATIKLDRPITITNGRVNLSDRDEGVFRVEGALPRSVQTRDGDWQYTWSMREVFADEVDGFVEVDPWS